MTDILKTFEKQYLDKEPFVSARVIAKHLELNVFTIYKRAERGKIPSYKFGKSRRFKLSEVEAAIMHVGS